MDAFYDAHQHRLGHPERPHVEKTAQYFQASDTGPKNATSICFFEFFNPLPNIILSLN